MEQDLIELKELRIGNLLLYKGELVCVTLLSCDIDDEYEDQICFVKFGTSSNEKGGWNRSLVNDLERIPLTPEWLERMDTFIGSDLYKFIHTDFYLRYTETGVDMALDSLDGIKKHYFKYGIKYVHEIQNLYFALTGEELTIKETV